MTAIIHARLAEEGLVPDSPELASALEGQMPVETGRRRVPPGPL